MESCSVESIARKGHRESRAASMTAKATEGVKNLDSSPEELLGVGGAECCESKRRNKGWLVRSEVHNLRDPGYKPRGEISRDAA